MGHKSKPKTPAPMPDPDPADAEGADEGVVFEIDDADIGDISEIEAAFAGGSSGGSSGELETVKAELAEAIAARQRALADFRNFQRRSRENEDQARKEGVRQAARALFPALDQFDLALGHQQDVTVEQLLAGVQMVRDEIVRGLAGVGVEQIAPDWGDEFDPNLHAAVQREPTIDLPENSVVRMLQVGYRFGGQVLRPATVIVSALPDDDE